jgi:hypothetical protein
MGVVELEHSPDPAELPGLQAALRIVLVHMEWHLKAGMDAAAEADLITAYCIERRIRLIDPQQDTSSRKADATDTHQPALSPR